MNASPAPTQLVSSLRLLAFAGLTTLTGFQAQAIVVTPTGNATTLVNTLIGPGVTLVGTPTLTGGNLGNANSSAATFTNGLTTGIGINSGVLLTSGFANLVGNSNTTDATTGSFGGPGDAQLTALAGGTPTNDATVLTFSFTTTTGNLFFNFAFGSEEYNEFTNSNFNDVFGFFVNGTNIALLPGTNTPISINTVNGGNPLGVGAVNPQFFNNNDPDDGGPFFNFEYDGFTDVFTVSALGLGPGTHTIKLAIADGADFNLDSGVFIQAGSFTPELPPPGVPDAGSTLVLAMLGATVVGAFRKMKLGQKA